MSAVTNTKRNILTIQQRLEILEKWKNGGSVPQIANKHNISVKKVQYVIQNADKIREAVKRGMNVKTMSINPLKYKKLDDQLYEWYLERQASNDIITVEQFHQKAYEIAINVEGPSNMHQFLQQFTERHGIQVQRNVKTERIGTIKYIKLYEQLFEWCQERQASGDTITYKLLCQKSFEIANIVGKPSSMNMFLYRFIYRFIKCHKIQLESRNMTEILQNPVQRDDEATQSDAEKFIQEFSQRLEKENINKDNIYIMIKTDVIWKTLVQALLECADKTKITIQQIDDLKKKIITVIFCINVTGSHKLPPYPGELENENQRVSEHCESRLLVAHKLQENALTKESKDFEFWYDVMFKTLVEKYQENKNITGKVLLLVDNCILSEWIKQDDCFEVLFLLTNRVSFFKSVYLEIIQKIDQLFRKNMKEHLQNFFYEAKEFETDFIMHWCNNIICKSWVDIASEDIENLWRFLRQGRPTREDTSTLTSVNSQ
ncbi:unnamed protein product [Lasius platythorax]|uniref:HTH CENPB-type domain-containing protein n=1 Tax=Lasius platythorax TaxID=488582 RepID=A0AAV2NTR1_9HYME